MGTLHMGSARNNRKIIAAFFGVLAVFLVVLLLVYNGLVTRYRANVTFDSSSHLVEISNQAGLSIENTIARDEQLAQSVAESIDHSSYASMSDLLSCLKHQRDIWNVDSLYVYAEDGTCYDQDGTVQNRDASAELAYRILKAGTVFEFSDSHADYGVALHSNLTVDGKRIVAFSAARNLNDLIDSMGFNAFNGEAFMYLTQQNGVKISQSTSNDAPVVFNVSSLFDEGVVTGTSRSGMTIDEAMQQGVASVFLYTDASGVARYAVITPVKAIDQTWYLFSFRCRRPPWTRP